MEQDKGIIALKGTGAWYVMGRCYSGTFSLSPLTESEVDERFPGIIKVNKEAWLNAQENKVHALWIQPNLDLSLPDDNVRSLFEGCVGFQGKISGHKWGGDLSELNATDSVGLNVLLALFKAQGIEVSR